MYTRDELLEMVPEIMEDRMNDDPKVEVSSACSYSKCLTAKEIDELGEDGLKACHKEVEDIANKELENFMRLYPDSDIRTDFGDTVLEDGAHIFHAIVGLAK